MPTDPIPHLRALISEAEGQHARATEGPWRVLVAPKHLVAASHYIRAGEEPRADTICGSAMARKWKEQFERFDGPFIASSRTREPALCRALKAALVVVGVAREYEALPEIHDALAAFDEAVGREE